MFYLENKAIAFIFLSGKTHITWTDQKRKAFHFLLKEPPSLSKIRFSRAPNNLP